MLEAQEINENAYPDGHREVSSSVANLRARIIHWEARLAGASPESRGVIQQVLGDLREVLTELEQDGRRGEALPSDGSAGEPGARSAIEREHDLFEGIVSNVPVGVVVVEGDALRYILANPSFYQIMELDEPVIGRRLGTRLPQEQALAITGYLRSVMASGKPTSQQEFCMQVGPDKRDALFNVEIVPLKDECGVFNRLLLLIHDMTEEVTARQMVELERAKLRVVIENAPEAIMVADEEGRIILANLKAAAIFARPIPFGKAYTSQADLQICYPDGTPYDPRDLPLVRAALDGETFTNCENLVSLPDGKRRPLLGNVAPVHDHNGRRTGAVYIFQDLTERKQAEEEMMKNTAQVEIQRHLIHNRERERMQVAQNLHEGLLQELIGINYGISQALGIDDKTLRLERMRDLREALQDGIDELREYCYELRPPALVPFGVERAIRSHAETFQRNHPEIKLELDLFADRQMLPEPVRLSLFRIYQELLNGVVRQSDATEVTVTLRVRKNQAELEVRDNARSTHIPNSWVEIARQGHFGLVAAQERAEAMGGSIRIKSSTKRGTQVLVVLPVQYEVYLPGMEK